MIFQVTPLQLQTFFDTIITALHYGIPLTLLYLLGKRKGINDKVEIECQALADKLEKISGQLPGVIYQFRLNPDGTCCFPYASEAIKEIYRVTPQDVQHNADKVFSILHFEDFERVYSSIFESAKNLTPWNQEYRVKFDDGTIRWLHGNALPQRETDGSTLWHGFITDITAKKRIEIDYKSVVNASFNGFFSVNFSGRILSANQAFCEILRYNKDELLSMSIHDIEQYEKPEEITAHIHRIVETGRDQFETKHRRKDGKIINVAISTVFLPALGQRLFVFVNDITSQKEVALQLQASETRFKDLFENAPLPYQSLDINGNFLHVNQAWLDLVGCCSREEVIGKFFGDFMTESSKSLVYQTFSQFKQEGHVSSPVFELARRDTGEKRLIVVEGKIARDPQGVFERTHCILTDVTEQYRAEQELKESAERLRASEFRWKFAIEGSGDGLWDWDISKKTVFFSKRWKEMIGFAEDEFENNFEEWKKRIHPDDEEKVFTALEDYFAEKTSIYLVEYRLQCKDGTYEWIFARGMVVNRDENYEPIRMIGTHTDITQRKATEQALLESEFRWKFAIDGSGDGLWDWDIPNGTVFFSKRWKEMLGFAEDEIGNNLKEWEGRIHPDDLQSVMATVQDYLEDKTTLYINEHRVLCKDGSYKWILDRGITVNRGKNNEPIRMIGTHTDITEHKEIEKELKRSNADLEQFAYAISHDMRQPLRMVTSYLNLLETALQTKLDEDSRTFLDFAVDGAKRMDSMILSLLDYSRVGRRTQPAALISSRTCLDETLSFFKPDLESSGAQIEITGDWVNLSASRDEITRLLQNLIGNALKYHEANKPPLVKVCASVEQNTFRVEVQDNGIGIEPNQMERLFKVFSRLQSRSRFEGTGVGLALCRKIVEHHGGKIGVHSDGEGCGCTFWFEVPIGEIQS